MRVLVFALITAIALGCGALKGPQQREPYQRQAVFVEEEYRLYAESGTGSISGQAFFKTAGGDVKYGAGDEIYLNPVTTYSTEWFKNHVVAERLISPSDPRALQYMRHTTADGEGRFKFEKLPAGGYYLMCRIVWQYAGGYRGSLLSTGGLAYGQTKIGNGEQVTNVIVTRR